MPKKPRRSSLWPAARRRHLAEHPECVACGSRARIEVHHVRPFHLYPDMELDPDNLISLCENEGHNCHLIWGHLLLWAAWNPTVRRDAAAYRAAVECRRVDRA